MKTPPLVRTELVEVLSFVVPRAKEFEEKGQGFDKLSPNGKCFDVR